MKKMFAISMIVLALGLALPAQEKPIKSLTMADVIEQTLKNNLDLQIEMSNPEIAKALWDKSRAMFIPTLTLGFTQTSKTTPSASIITGVDIEKPDSVSFGFNLSQKLLLGGNLDISLQNSRNSTNSRDVNINPRYFSQLQFNLAQPLLKSFGLTATKRSIYIARNNRDKSLFALKQQVIDLIYQTEEAYWNLVYSHQNMAVKEKSLQLAKDLLKQNETQVKVGVSAPMDILTAQAEVAAREGEALQARSQIQTYEENLRRILNLSQMPEAIVPSEQPLFSPVQADFNDFLADGPGEEARYRAGAPRPEEQEHRRALLPQPDAARPAAHRLLLHPGNERHAAAGRLFPFPAVSAAISAIRCAIR